MVNTFLSLNVKLQQLFKLAACVCSYLVAKCTLFSADVSDQVSGLFGHLIQKHVTQRQASIPYVVTLWTKKSKKNSLVINMTSFNSNNTVLGKSFDMLRI